MFSGNVEPQEPSAYDECIAVLRNDGLENLAGYICHKLKDEVPAQVEENGTCPWVHHLNEGGLSKPSNELMECLEECNQTFDRLNANGLLIAHQYIKTHLLESEYILCAEKVKKLFFRCRMYFKIRALNNDILQNQYKLKRKFNKITN